MRKPNMQGQLLGHYEIVEMLGAGGMGTVYKARDRSLDRFVAIKVLSPALENDPVCVERFQLEAKSIASIRHPNLIHIYSVDSFEGLHYFAMEFIEGSSLNRVLQERAPLSIEETMRWTGQILSALGKVHEVGIVHRDMKPGNVMIDSDGRAVVLDFGLVKDTSVASGLTSAGAIVGTPEYMAPEQIEGEAVSAATDIYAVSIMVFEMLTRVLPFHRKSPVLTMRAHCEEAAPLLSAYRADLPPGLADVLHRGMTRNPEDRISSASVLEKELREACSALLEGGSLTTVHAASAKTVVQAPATAATTTQRKGRKRPARQMRSGPAGSWRRRITLAVGLFFGLMVLILVVRGCRRRNRNGAPSDPLPVEAVEIKKTIHNQSDGVTDAPVRLLLSDQTVVVGELQASAAGELRLRRSSDGKLITISIEKVEAILTEKWLEKRMPHRGGRRPVSTEK